MTQQNLLEGHQIVERILDASNIKSESKIPVKPNGFMLVLMYGKHVHTLGKWVQLVLAQNSIHLRVTQFTKKVKTTILEDSVLVMEQNG